MIPGWLKILLLASLALAFVALPSALAQQQRQRRVFTNDEVARPAPPSAPATATPAEKPAASAEKTPGSESTPAAPGAAAPAAAEPPGGLPQGLSLAQYLQGVLRRFHAEFAEKLEQETDASRQERWRNMMNLTMQLMTQNQLYISELDSQAKAAAPPGNPESPSSPATPPNPQ